MSVWEEEDEDGGASREWTAIPLRRRGIICAEAVQRLLLRWLAVVRIFQEEEGWRSAVVGTSERKARTYHRSLGKRHTRNGSVLSEPCCRPHEMRVG
jgi:hypothetical protein